MRNEVASSVCAVAVAAAIVTFAAACGGGSGKPASPAPPDGRPSAVAPPADTTPAPIATAATEAPPDGPPGAGGDVTPTSTPPSQTPTPAPAPTHTPAATPTTAPVASDITITMGPDCAFAPNPASVQQDGVVRFANGAGYLAEVAVFFANDAGFDGAEVEPGEVSPPIVAAHTGRAELTCEGPERQFARGVLFVAPAQP